MIPMTTNRVKWGGWGWLVSYTLIKFENSNLFLLALLYARLTTANSYFVYIYILEFLIPFYY